MALRAAPIGSVTCGIGLDGSGPGARVHLGGPRQCLRVDILPDVRHLAISDGKVKDEMVFERLICGFDSPLSEDTVADRLLLPLEQILEDEATPSLAACVHQHATLVELAQLDGCEPELFGQIRHGSGRVLVVARQKDDPVAALDDRIGSQGFCFQMIETFHELSAGERLRNEGGGRKTVQFLRWDWKRVHRVDDRLTFPTCFIMSFLRFTTPYGAPNNRMERPAGRSASELRESAVNGDLARGHEAAVRRREKGSHGSDLRRIGHALERGHRGVSLLALLA